LYRSVALVAALTLAIPPPSFAQTPGPAVAGAAATTFNAEQLDALLAPIALYPDALLTQVLMASTYPLQVVEASRWLDNPANKSLSGDALTQALAGQNWDPSVKSLVPFPQVLSMLNEKLDWTQQLGYAFATQQADVMNSVQRLRLQAQNAGYLKTNEQQRVVMENSTISIDPPTPQTVYVPVYNPTVVYGAWPYPAYPPVYIPPPPGYVVGSAFMSGLAFAAGVAVVGSLWGWARPSWYGGNVNVNVNRYNTINVNRPPINSAVWRPPAGGVGGRPIRPPVGPVGTPARPVPLPANAIGRPSVQVPSSAVNRSAAGNLQAQRGTAQRPAGGQPGAVGGQRPGGSVQGGNTPRPGGAQPPGSGQRPGGGVNRPPTTAQRPPGAFGGINDGARANQFANRGAQSRNAQPQQRPGNAGGSGGQRQASQPSARAPSGGARVPGRAR
jgi:hypothetical protein